MSEDIQKKQPVILIVDDDWMSREMMQAHLENSDYRVFMAHNGQKALQLAFENPPDLVLLDIRMHGMDGYEVCRKLKSDERTKYAPVVMVTALESEDDKLKAIESGADDFLSKPFSSLMMLTRVRSLLRIKRLHDELEDRNALLRKVLNRYVNEFIADVILSDPEKNLKLGGETRPVTVFFADIRGFTAFSEQYPAEEVLALLNRFFNKLTEVVFEHHGTFDKYMGDAIMAFFGAPVATGQDTLNAVRAALTMQRAFTDFKTELNDSKLDHLGLGIGLNTGDAAVGNIGSERVMNYTVIGDAVNTAHRLQEVANDGMTIISEATYTLVKDNVVAERLKPINVKGKREPQVIYNVTGLREPHP